MSKITEIVDDVIAKTNTNTTDIATIETIASSHIGISGVTAYHLLQGNLAVDNTVTTQGFNTTLYTSGSATTNIDMNTQWGNTAEEKFGGLVWLKDRVETTNNFLYDTVRGATKEINSNTTDAEAILASGLTAFNSTGFTVGADAGHNSTTNNMVSWNFQTTHRITGTTNHGKAYTCHYNPFTGFTIVKYEGSGIAGHEIPHHLGRKLGFVTVKNITAVANWESHFDSIGRLKLNLTDAYATDYKVDLLENNVSLPYTQADWNASGNQYIMYGWANSYFDESNKLIGNYEVGVYQGTGASGNKVKTRGKPAWVMIKRLDSTGDWVMYDNLRQGGSNFDGELYANLSNAETMNLDRITWVSDGFYPIANTVNNISGGQYLYMVAYDTNSNGGGGYYSRATDTSNLQVQNAIIPFANGIDSNGVKITTLSKNETISGLALTAGKNYVYSKNDGAYGVSKYAPCYGLAPTRTKAGETPDFFDIAKNKWFTTTGGSELVTNGTFDSNTNGWTNGTVQPTWDKGTMKLNTSDWFHTSFTVSPYTKYTLVINRAVGIESNTILTIGEGNLSYPSVRYIDAIYLSSGYSRIEFTTQNTTQVGIYLYCNSAGVSYFDNISVFEAEPTIGTEITESRNYLNHIVYADNDGSPLYVEELPKIEYKDSLQVNSLNVISGFNLNQTWQDVTSSRVAGATYTNTTGKPITVSIRVDVNTNTYIQLLVNGIEASRCGTNSTTYIRMSIEATVPSGATYKLNYDIGTSAYRTWLELR